MQQVKITEKVRAYAADSFFTEDGLAQIIGVRQSIFSGLLNGNYKHAIYAHTSKMEKFFNEGVAQELEDISKRLKALTVENYLSGNFPDFIAIRRMELHRRRSELMNMNKTRMSKPAKAVSSLQQAV